LTSGGGLGFLGAVLGPALVAPIHARSVERAAHNVVSNTREILHTAAADQHDRVLLEVVSLTRNVGRHFDLIRQAHTGDFPKGRVGLFGSRGVDARTNAAAKRIRLQRRRFLLLDDIPACPPDELVDSRHTLEVSLIPRPKPVEADSYHTGTVNMRQAVAAPCTS